MEVIQYEAFQSTAYGKGMMLKISTGIVSILGIDKKIVYGWRVATNILAHSKPQALQF